MLHILRIMYSQSGHVPSKLSANNYRQHAALESRAHSSVVGQQQQ